MTEAGCRLVYAHKENYLVVVGYYTRDFASVQYNIQCCQEILATHGLPDFLILDNGPQFQSKEFRDFARECDFKHETSSPDFPQANGEAERG